MAGRFVSVESQPLQQQQEQAHDVFRLFPQTELFTCVRLTSLRPDEKRRRLSLQTFQQKREKRKLLLLGQFFDCELLVVALLCFKLLLN